MAEQATQRKPVILVNTTPCIRQFVIPMRTTVAGATSVENQVVAIKPGANKLDGETYAKVAKDIETDLAIELMDKPITSMREPEAIKVATMTIDAALLKVFAAVEKRPNVIKAINDQLFALRTIDAPNTTDDE